MNLPRGMKPTAIDWWPLIAEHLGDAIQEWIDELKIMSEAGPAEWGGLLAELEARYRAGNKEHGGDWIQWDRERFIAEARQETLDRILYPAMRLVRHGE